MIIIGTEKIRSVLDLPIVKLQIKKGEKRYVSEKDFWGSDVQNAITLGFLKADKEEVQTSLEVNDRMARIKNISGRPISIPGFQEEIKDTQIFTIRESRLKEGAFQNAMVRKMIAVVGILGSENDISEGSVFLDDGSYVKTPKEEPKEPSEATVTLTREFFKKAEEKDEPLETNIEVKPRGVIDNPNPKPVTKEEIPDARNRSSTWNPAKNPVFVEMNKTEEVTKTPPAEPEKDPRKASVVWDPTRGKGNEAKIVGPNKEQNNAEITFVDSEQEEQKIASHPKNKKGKK